MDAFARRWKLIRMLLRGPLYRSEVLRQMVALADAHDSHLSESTLSADVKALRHLGIGFRPLGPGDKSTRQAYELDLERVDLFASNAEAAALQTAVALFSELKLPEAEQLGRLFERIPVEVREGLTDPYTGQLLRTGDTRYDSRVMESLQQGIRTGRMMRLTYRPLNREPRTYLVDRARLTWYEGYLYLQAHCPEAEGHTVWHRNREFRLDRFCSIRDQPAVQVLETPAEFEHVPAFEFQLWLAASMAQGFKAVPRRMRILEDAPDGSRRVAISETIPLRAVRKVLSYGIQARVVEPDFIVDEVRKTVARLAMEQGLLADNREPML